MEKELTTNEESNDFNRNNISVEKVESLKKEYDSILQGGIRKCEEIENLVNYIDPNYKVKQLKPKNINRGYANLVGIMEMPSNIKSINSEQMKAKTKHTPITPKLLLSLGFNQMQGTMYFKGKYGLQSTIKGSFDYMDFLIEDRAIGTVVSSVEQLDNLYHALTGDYLTNPTK